MFQNLTRLRSSRNRKAKLIAKSKVINQHFMLKLGDMINYFKNISEDAEFTGLNLIVGAWCVHLLECDAVTMTKMLKSLHESASQPNSIYS